MKPPNLYQIQFYQRVARQDLAHDPHLASGVLSLVHYAAPGAIARPSLNLHATTVSLTTEESVPEISGAGPGGATHSRPDRRAAPGNRAGRSAARGADSPATERPLLPR
jgi:hypothetical protein